MKKLLAAAALCVAVFTACGGDEPAATPAPSPSYEPGAAPAYQNGGVLGPAGEARDVVDQLNQQQADTEQQTGGP